MKKWLAVLVVVVSFSGSACYKTKVGENTATPLTTSSPTSDNTVHEITPDVIDPQLEKSFQDEIDGLNRLNTFVQSKDWSSAEPLVSNLHIELHSDILPLIEAKNGADYTDKMHDAFDALEDAIKDENQKEALDLISKNMSNIQEMAKVLSVKIVH